MLTPISYNNQLHFGANLNSPKLKLSQKDFFIKIKGYGQNPKWAKQIKITTDYAVNTIHRDLSAEQILNYITRNVMSANQIPLDYGKRLNSGILRTTREDWEYCNRDIDIITCYKIKRYNSYADRLDIVKDKPLAPINKNLGMSYPDEMGYIQHGPATKINNSLDYIFKLYKNKYSKFLHKDVKKEDLPEIIDIVAEIRWVLAHATPWLRGSDAISNVFMRAMLKAVGVKAYPPAKGISYDLEAYCRNLDDYKANFNSFFEKPLEVIE